MLRIRPFVFLACIALALTCTACGGGGGDPVPPPGAPGVLRALAVEGQPAPGTAGNFGAFPAQPSMDVAAGGWSAFVAPTTDATKTRVLYVAQPDATLVEVYAVGDAVPAPGTGNITQLHGVWMCAGGIVLVQVSISGGVPTFGMLSAVVAGGAATQKNDVFYEGDPLPAPAAGTLVGWGPGAPVAEDDGTFWFQGLESGSFFAHLFSVDRDGTNLTVRAQRTGPLPAGDNLFTIDAFSVDPTGTYYAIVATPTVLGPRRILVRAVGGAAFVEIMRDGSALPAGTAAGTVMNIHKGGWLNVYANGEVIWMAMASLVAADDVFLWGNATGLASVAVLARTGDTAPSTGGTFGALDALNQASGSAIPQFAALVVGSPSGSTFGTFGIVAKGAQPAMGTAHFMQADVGLLGATYVGLAPGMPYTHISANASFLFANVLNGGLSAVLWMIPLQGVYAVAVETGAAPGGDTFGSFAASSAHVVADGSALFRAPLTTAGSGIFRRGP